MAGMKLEGFHGLVPRTSPRLLPPMAATIARNTKLLNGELRGFRAPRELADFTGESFTVRRAFRVPDVTGEYYGDGWLVFDNRNVDVVRSPIVNDAHDRYYWVGDGRPMYNTRDRILNGDPPLFLGIPTPTLAPTVSPPGGTASTRAYVYTFVSAYGEEGPNSPPTIATGDAGTWTLSNLPTTVPDAANRNITRKRIYRTVPGQESTLYFYVGETSLAASTFVDEEGDSDVVLNNVLESTTWLEPPSTLEGWTIMPNGYLIAWDGRRLVMSEPYRPHAWPAEYELSTAFEIVGAVVYGATAVIGTRSQPYFGQGVHPAAFTLQKLDAIEPCLSKRGMVATVAGAYYPSINGLVLANLEGVRVITQDILTKEEWEAYNPTELFAAPLGLQYIAFNSETFGLVFNPTEATTKLVELDRFSGVTGIETDPYTGNVFYLSQDRAWDWDPDNSERLFWRWRSKEYQTPMPLNFGAARIQFDNVDYDIEEDILSYYYPYNQSRFAAGSLNTLGGHALCGDPEGVGLVDGWTEPELAMPLGGDLLYRINDMLFQLPAVRFRVYAGGNVVYDAVINSERIIRLPSGFKSDLWQFELVGNTAVYSVQVAETPRGLAEL